MEDICASAGSSSHQHGDCASAGSSSHQHGDRPYPRWTGARLRYSRSLPGRLSGGARLRSSRSLPGRLSEIMAPLKWPEPVLDYFVDECFKMVQDGRSPANENSFFQILDRSMSKQSFGTTYCRMDLIQQFRRVRSLWDTYHEILKNLEIIKVQERQSQTDPDKLRLKTGDIYASKFILIRKYEIKLNTIFESFYGSKAKSLSTYRFNIEHSDRYSGDNSISSKRRSLGEPFSRQLRLKSSDMPESSQNGSASEIQDYDIAMGELIDKVDDGTYIIAGQCLRDPKILRSYSYIPTIERKISFLHGTWRVSLESAPAGSVNVNYGMKKKNCTIQECIELVESIEELSDQEKAYASDIMRLEDNREIFMNFKNQQVRLFWIKHRLASLVNNPSAEHAVEDQRTA